MKKIIGPAGALLVHDDLYDGLIATGEYRAPDVVEEPEEEEEEEEEDDDSA